MNHTNEDGEEVLGNLGTQECNLKRNVSCKIVLNIISINVQNILFSDMLHRTS